MGSHFQDAARRLESLNLPLRLAVYRIYDKGSLLLLLMRLTSLRSMIAQYVLGEWLPLLSLVISGPNQNPVTFEDACKKTNVKCWK